MKASELAVLVGGSLRGPDRVFEGVAPLASAGPRQAAFARRPPREPVHAGVLLTTAPVEGVTTVVVEDPRLAFARILEHLFPEVHPSGIQPGAFVHPTARVAEGASVYPGAYVGRDVEVGEGSVVFPNAVLLAGTRVGRDCHVGPGAVVGAPGFGVHPTRRGPRPVPQVGRVVLEDGVRLGALTTVDRAFLEETRIGEGSQLDDQVHVAHNCRLGRGVVVAAQSGLSGSVTLEDGALLGGQVGIADHVRVGAGAHIGAQSGIHRDLAGGRRWMGTPALPLRAAARFFAARKELPALIRRVRRLERAVSALLEERGDRDEE